MTHRLLSLLLLSVGCQTPDSTPATANDEKSQSPSAEAPPSMHAKPGQISHAVDIQPIWDASCTSGCHPGNDSMLSLEAEFAWKTMVGIPSVEIPLMDRVEPGEPDQSYLVHKIEDTHLDVGGMGFAMPSFSDLLAEDDIQLVRDWIEQGAAP